MALVDLFIHTVEVFRRSGELDRLGQAVDVNPSQYEPGTGIASYPCRLDPGKGGLVMQERAIDVFEVRYMVYTHPDVDIREDDALRVTGVFGEELMPPSKVVLKNFSYGEKLPHHLEILCISQRGPI